MQRNYARRYQEILRLLYGNGSFSGFGAAVVEATEARLGCRLPEALRQFYLSVGKEARAMRTHNRFLVPAELALVDARLVFCDENQSVCQWSVDCAAEDPLVLQGVPNADSVDWYSEELNCSDFLVVMLYLQAVWGGYTHRAEHREPTQVLAVLERERTLRVNHNGARIYQRGSVLICSLDGDPHLLAAGREAEDIGRLCSELGFESL